MYEVCCNVNFSFGTPPCHYCYTILQNSLNDFERTDSESDMHNKKGVSDFSGSFTHLNN